MTMYQDKYSRPLKETAKEVLTNYDKKNEMAGTQERPVDKQSIKMTSVLTAEKYKDSTYKFLTNFSEGP